MPYLVNCHRWNPPATFTWYGEMSLQIGLGQTLGAHTIWPYGIVDLVGWQRDYIVMGDLPIVHMEDELMTVRLRLVTRPRGSSASRLPFGDDLCVADIGQPWGRASVVNI